MLEQKGLEAAHVAYERFGQTGHLKTARTSDERLSAIITAYLEAVGGEPVQAPAVRVKGDSHNESNGVE